MNKLVPAVALTLGLISAAHADDCRRSAQRSANVDTAGVTKVVLGTGAGDLEVRGQSGLNALRANGEACASNDDLLGKIQLESRREGSTLYLKTVMPELKDGAFLFNEYARLDLKVQLPDTVDVELEDSSGDLELSRVKSAVVADSSGDIEIEDIAGNLDVSDSSGDIEIERVAGGVKVKDSSGDMTIEGTRGTVEVTVDSSGDIRIVQADSVHIHQDSSGGIVVRQVNRDVRIDSDSSGDIDVAEVSGNFSVGADSSGDVRQAKVLGKVELPER